MDGPFEISFIKILSEECLSLIPDYSNGVGAYLSSVVCPQLKAAIIQAFFLCS